MGQCFSLLACSFSPDDGGAVFFSGYRDGTAHALKAFVLAGPAVLSLLVQRKYAKKAHPGGASLRDALRCSRARGRRFDATSCRGEARRASLPAVPCARSAARCATRAPGHVNSKSGSVTTVGCVSRRRNPPHGKRSEPWCRAFNAPLAAPDGVARAVGRPDMDVRPSFAATGCRVEATPSTPLQPGTLRGFIAKGANSGPAFFGYFLCRSKESNPRPGRTNTLRSQQTQSDQPQRSAISNQQSAIRNQQSAAKLSAHTPAIAPRYCADYHPD